MEADEAVFLDDIASNLKPASRMGISTIKVNDVTSALGELQSLLSVDLGVTPGTSRIRRGMEIDQARLERYLADKLNITGKKLTVSNEKLYVKLNSRIYDFETVPTRPVQPYLPYQEWGQENSPQEETSWKTSSRRSCY